jgi:glycosyltransferase involved in cell wall biosynthesis
MGERRRAGDSPPKRPGSLRVALLSYRSKPHSGGQGVYVRNLSRALVELGHRVEVFSGPPYPELDDGVGLTRVESLDLYREPDPFRVPSWRELRGGVDLLELGTMWTGGFPEPLTFSLRAARLLARERHRFDVVHDNQSLGYGLLALARRGLPLVATIHHPITVDLRLELEAAPSRLRRLALRRWYGFHRMQARVARRIAPLLTVSSASAGDIVRDFRVHPSALRIVPAGVDTTLFRPRAEPRTPGRIVTVSSSHSPLKGLQVLVDAVARLGTVPGLELVVAGRPAPNGPVARAVADLGLAGTVRFVDGLSDEALAQLLASAEVAAVPSLYEGFSLPAIEAMACGTPLVATRAGALPEVVGDDGSCALLVAPGDGRELASAIASLLRDPLHRARLGEAGRARVRERYAWEAVARATVACYEEAIAVTRLGSPAIRPAVPRALPLPVAEDQRSC